MLVIVYYLCNIFIIVIELCLKIELNMILDD